MVYVYMRAQETPTHTKHPQAHGEDQEEGPARARRQEQEAAHAHNEPCQPSRAKETSQDQTVNALTSAYIRLHPLYTSLQ